MYTHRALVTYSNERTGEIRVKVPAVTGTAELSISYVGRSQFNGIWVVPYIGDQIVVSADDEELTNLFWIHTDGYKYTQNYRLYASYFSTANQTLTTAGTSKAITYNNTVFQRGIRLVDSSKITFDYAGKFNLQYSIQWVNTENKINESIVWLKYKNVDYENSSTYVSIPNSHGGGNGKTVTSANFFGESEVGGYVELWWGADSTTVSIATLTTETGLPSAPTSPGIIVTVDQIA